MPALVAALRDKDERVRSAAAAALAYLRQAPDQSLPALLEMLASEQYRLTAIRALGAMGRTAKEAVPPLVGILEDRKNDTAVRASAADALSRIDPTDGRVIAALIQGLQGDLLLANRCQFALLLSGPAAVRALAAASGDPGYKARGRAVEILARRGRAPGDVIPILARALNDADPAASKQAGVGLGEMGPRGLPALLAAARGDDPRARAAAVFGLALFPPPPEAARKALVTALQDEDAEVRSAAAAAVGRVAAAASRSRARSAHRMPQLTDAPGAARSMGRDDAGEWVLALVAMVQSGKSRAAAIGALAEIGPDARDAVPSLAAVLRSGDAPDRKASATALARIGEPAVAALLAALRDQDADARRLAAEALGRIPSSGPGVHPRLAERFDAEVLPALAEALKDGRIEVRRSAALCISEILRPVLDRAALERAGITNPTTRFEISQAPVNEEAKTASTDLVLRTGRAGQVAIPALVEVLGDADSQLAGTAASILTRSGKAALPALRKAPRDKQGRLPARVVIVMNQIDPTMDGMVPALLAASRDPNVALEVAHALAGKGERVVPELIAALKDRDAETRHMSGVALQMIGPTARAAVPALLELLKSEADRWWAGDALRAIDSKAAAAAGIAGPN